MRVAAARTQHLKITVTLGAVLAASAVMGCATTNEWEDAMAVGGAPAHSAAATGGTAPDAAGGTAPDAAGGTAPDAAGGTAPDAAGGTAPDAAGGSDSPGSGGSLLGAGGSTSASSGGAVTTGGSTATATGGTTTVVPDELPDCNSSNQGTACQSISNAWCDTAAGKCICAPNHSVCAGACTYVWDDAHCGDCITTCTQPTYCQLNAGCVTP